MKVLFAIVVVLLLIVTACTTSAPAPQPTPEQAATWAAASHVTLTFNPENVHGCTLIRPVEYCECQQLWSTIPPQPSTITLPSSNGQDMFLLFRTAALGGNVALVAPNHGEPPEMQSYREQLRKAQSFYALELAAKRIAETRWIIGEAYRCDTTK
jgi:hypothetical protein